MSTKTADRPHRLTVFLSAAALIVSVGSATFSFLSLQETRVNRAINEETSRAYVRIVSLLLDTPTLLGSSWSNKWVEGSITLTNTGRVSAHDVRALLDINPPRAEHLYELARFEEIVPGASLTTKIRFRLEDNRSLTSSSDTKEYSLSLKVEYADGLLEGTKIDEVFFCVPPPTPKDKGLAVLTACYTNYDRESFK